MSRVKVISKAQFDTSKIGSSQYLDIDTDELETLISEIDEYRPEDLSNLSELELEKAMTLPYKGPQGEIIWDHPNIGKLPEFLQDVTTMITDVFNLGKEVKAFNFKIFPPNTKDHLKANPKLTNSVDRVEQHLAMNMTRIVIPVGSKENLHLTVTVPGQRNMSNSVLVRESYGYQFGFGLIGNIDVSWDHKYEFKAAPRAGFRAMKTKKQPLNRWMVVIDCINDMSVVIDTLKKSIGSLSGGDSKKKEELMASLDAAIKKSSVDTIADMANSVSLDEPIEHDLD